MKTYSQHQRWLQAFAPELYQLFFGYPGAIHDTVAYEDFDIYDYSYTSYNTSDYGSQYEPDYGPSNFSPPTSTGDPDDEARYYEKYNREDYNTSDYSHFWDTSSENETDYVHPEGGMDWNVSSDYTSDYTNSDYPVFDYSNMDSHPTLITPNVLRAAREHFNCSELTGVPLEEQSPAHLDQRIFQVRTCSHNLTAPCRGMMQKVALLLCSLW